MEEEKLLEEFYQVVMILAGHLQSPRHSEIAWHNKRVAATNLLLEISRKILEIRAGTELADSNVVDLESWRKEKCPDS